MGVGSAVATAMAYDKETQLRGAAKEKNERARARYQLQSPDSPATTGLGWRAGIQLHGPAMAILHSIQNSSWEEMETHHHMRLLRSPDLSK